MTQPAPHHSAVTRLLAPLVLVLLIALIAGGVWLFPRAAAFMNRQDCIATGHVNCGS